MPKVLEWNGYRIFFFSNEGNPREACHVHVRKGDSLAKFWMTPVVTLSESWGMTSGELARLQRAIEANENLIRSKWDEHFGS